MRNLDFVFVAYLWGIETRQIPDPRMRLPGFVAYLWGIETTLNTSCHVMAGTVCSLPMRDWNADTMAQKKTRSAFVAYLWGIETIVNLTADNFPHLFVAYLWGIETCVEQLFKKPMSLVCSLPMRDWNLAYGAVLPKVLSVCSLPMRDWNLITFLISFTPPFVCSLPMRDWNTSTNRPPGTNRPGL